MLLTWWGEDVGLAQTTVCRTSGFRLCGSVGDP
jgi:hypothetical protein